MRVKLGAKDGLALGLFLCLAAGSFIYDRHGQPTVESATGRFESDCCGEVVIGRTSLAYQGGEVRLRFHYMKFGLTAYADQVLGPFFGVSGTDREPPVIYFHGPDTFTVVGYRGKPTEFSRIR
jgi:hypothetical protein